MKNYFKKFSIICLMAFAIIGVGLIQGGSIANAATYGDQLFQPEDGWKRCDDTDKNIEYSDKFGSYTSGGYYNKTCHYLISASEGQHYIKFNFYGSKLRVISNIADPHTDDVEISFDGGKTFEVFSTYWKSTSSISFALVYEKTGLEKKIHNVIIKIPNKEIGTYSSQFYFDAVDIDNDGYLEKYNEIKNELISLNKSSIDLKVNDSKQLTATTTPAGAEIVWSSSDPSIATIDSNGKVIGIKEGQATITAQIKGTDIKADCIVNVTKEETAVEPSGNGSLCIEMVDGNIKQAQNLDTSDFIKWYQNRDLDKTEKPFYKITNAKGNVEYLIHDKIVAFEIR